MTEQLDRSLWARRAYSWLFGIFALVALILAAAGIYGVISYAVSQRTAGDRHPHGAGCEPARSAPGRAARRNGSGGRWFRTRPCGVTVAASTLLEKLLFGISPHDPLVYSAVLLAVAAVGVPANAIPARRASSLDPMRALRAE
jgi:putative ABC transport system permease protein